MIRPLGDQGPEAGQRVEHQVDLGGEKVGLVGGVGGRRLRRLKHVEEGQPQAGPLECDAERSLKLSLEFVDSIWIGTGLEKPEVITKLRINVREKL